MSMTSAAASRASFLEFAPTLSPPLGNVLNSNLCLIAGTSSWWVIVSCLSRQPMVIDMHCVEEGC